MLYIDKAFHQGEDNIGGLGKHNARDISNAGQGVRREKKGDSAVCTVAGRNATASFRGSKVPPTAAAVRGGSSKRLPTTSRGRGGPLAVAAAPRVRKTASQGKPEIIILNYTVL